ncbi:M20/M25/M40 family metallo-hydrolase [Planococcus shenhongbingii]|uniref:M20/M25/M40 family metallo-hydrolase n=1 Tax=Planococcus shenhongbingii TaxID=3058398 RepID=A0ABT8NHQ2_9BACL|nr:MULTISPECIES: M20/M25/M40 family metallo-hydrolase [unclassified Planococcus (in: firmicutes)]MDN7247427.1 M20/M25/M40 family metallo-hydrolase [Planococcus sp. N017]WKA59555.1 M20/M25/M40 family metallo-hydrolase [Planococcus sp. N016]
MIELLKDLIKIESDTKQGANDALLFCADWLKNNGQDITVHNNDGYLMLTAIKGQGTKTIVWNGHVDVVPGHAEQFVPMEESGRVYGRGAADMKAGVAAMMQAFVELDEGKLNQIVQLHIVTDEEIGGRNTSKWLVDQGYHGDFVICGEPTGLKVGLQSKGILRMDLTFKGKPAHGSRPWEGINAIESAMKFHIAMAELPFRKESTEYYEQPSVNLPIINAGERYNVVPEICHMSYDIRFMPGQDKQEIIRQMVELSETLNLDMEYKASGSTPALTTSKENPFIQTLQKAIKQTTGKEPVLFGQHGAADTRYYASVNGGEGAIEFGPAGDDWHGNAEFVLLSSVQEYKEVLISLAYS